MTTAANRVTILVSELHVMPSDIMDKINFKAALFLILAVYAFPAGAQQTNAEPEASAQEAEATKQTKAETTRKDYEPASRFVPSEKLRADDAISFPVDI